MRQARGEGKPLHNDSAYATHYVKGQHLSETETPFPRPNTFLEEVAAVCLLTTFLGSFYAVPIGGWVALYFCVFHKSTVAAAICVVFILDIITPSKAWPAFHNSKLWDNVRRRYRMRVLLPDDPPLDTRKRYLIAQFPHACFPLAAFLVGVLPHDVGFPDRCTPGAVASILLQIPIIKHVFAWTACFPAAKKELIAALQKDSVGMCPEGVAGVFKGANRSREQIYLGPRKGFIKVAIVAGVDIMPVYHLGNSQILTYAGNAWLSRRLRMTLGCFWGKWGTPCPYRTNFVTCVGQPIRVTQNDDPSVEEIDRIHKALVEELRTIYYQHRHLGPCSDRDLVIV